MFPELKVGNIVEPVSGRRWSSQEISHQVTVRLRHYEEIGMSGGDRAFLHFGNRLEFFADLLSIWGLGGCAILLDSRLTVFEVETLAQTSNPRLSIIDDKTDPSVAARMPSIFSRPAPIPISQVYSLQQSPSEALSLPLKRLG